MCNVLRFKQIFFPSARVTSSRVKSTNLEVFKAFVSNRALSSSTISQLANNSKAPGRCHASTAQREAVKPKQIAKFCSQCGGHIELQIPKTETEYRHVCQQCGDITYYNPKMVVGVICEHEGKVLLCKRAIEPCKGLWTLPAGFMEMGESTAEGAMRETLEEASAHVEIVAPYAHFDIPRIGQAYVLFRAKLQPPFTFGPSEESLEAALFAPDDIPFNQLAFSSISIALRFYAEESKRKLYRIHHGVVEKKAGSLPNDPSSFHLRDHMSFPTT